ncbi:hypothetical protein [Parvularcula marina]|nr:hypothetical protein [Parvularcula marina]
MRFTLFIIFLIIFTLVLLFAVGDRRQPAQTLTEKEIELPAR